MVRVLNEGTFVKRDYQNSESGEDFMPLSIDLKSIIASKSKVIALHDDVFWNILDFF